MAIYWNLQQRVRDKDWTAYELHKRAKIPEPTAYRLMADGAEELPIQRIETRVLERVAKALRVRPFSLLRVLPD